MPVAQASAKPGGSQRSSKVSEDSMLHIAFRIGYVATLQFMKITHNTVAVCHMGSLPPPHKRQQPALVQAWPLAREHHQTTDF